ncbi:DNA repair protein XRCC1 [Monocercomonoides exilis]|uniref:DNA repair protein XRCC1 n=1 Tax=Monocercomonoides exilis TaxID=2049356 RepID=UPI003559B77B|nr:DNA repair protein XRCC1 [Monocercomonoides exilis]|eukprot:MONOS_607.1-p1 / transcript=MONOS_607.1 / gene=MONOS_607 / organism=Monocercomonoides_exilis_PA203 / gene_product=DNA repair protein XRCC1 / transcript_product=DNA repair protein XRCC1 / location=Mono_scaffold00009:252584-254454(-) / protein_length=496 / sequence_SO=supercontig / SO=protein_coding / is_pseudo=false
MGLHVVNCSSEDPNFPSQNAIRKDRFWKTRGYVRHASIIFDINPPCCIHSLNFTNCGAETIEIFSCLASDSLDEYRTLLQRSMLLTPTDITKRTNSERNFHFGADDVAIVGLKSPVRRLRVVISTRFDNDHPYGFGGFNVVPLLDPLIENFLPKPAKPIAIPDEYNVFTKHESELMKSITSNFVSKITLASLNEADEDPFLDALKGKERGQSTSSRGSSSAANSPTSLSLKEKLGLLANIMKKKGAAAAAAGDGGANSNASSPHSIPKSLSPSNSPASSPTTTSHPPSGSSSSTFSASSPSAGIAAKKALSPSYSSSAPAARPGDKIPPKGMLPSLSTLTQPSKQPYHTQTASPSASSTHHLSNEPTKRKREDIDEDDRAMKEYARKEPQAKEDDRGMENKKVKIDDKEILKGVKFALSGFMGQDRSDLRDLGIKLGATYVADINDPYTHLVARYSNTPRVQSAIAEGKRIVKKEWLEQCSKQKKRLNEKDFIQK